MTTKIWVDYNDLAPDNITHTLIDFAEGPIELGQEVETFDTKGSTCPGVVVFIERERLVYILLHVEKMNKAASGGN